MPEEQDGGLFNSCPNECQVLGVGITLAHKHYPVAQTINADDIFSAT